MNEKIDRKIEELKEAIEGNLTYEQELKIEMKRLSVKKQEIENVAKLKAELAKRGLNISMLIKIAEEFKE